MRFFIRKKRQPPAVIIVALIDVLIVVMIFLMVTTTFKNTQLALKIVLPESSRATPQPGSSQNPPLVLQLDDKGVFHLGQLAVVVADTNLANELSKVARQNPEIQLNIVADTHAEVGKFMILMDAVEKSHIKNSKMLTQTAAKK